MTRIILREFAADLMHAVFDALAVALFLGLVFTVCAIWSFS